jgi:photosystem II stability/assembly factor-like uncharacterized protein
MKKLYRLLLLILPVTVFGQDGWTEQSSGIADNINSIHFFSSSSGFAAGNNGKLLKTDDGGSNWNIVSTGTTSSFQKIYFRNSNDGYLLTQNGELLTSSDKGVTWSSQSIDSQGLNGISFAGTSGVIVGANGSVFTSSNGLSWLESSSSLSVYALNDVIFFNDNLVVAIGGDGEIYKSVDKGLTWSVVNSGSTETLSAIEKMNDSTTVICGTKGTVLEYEPLTASIKAVATSLNSENNWLKDVSCSQDDICQIVGTNSTVLLKVYTKWIQRDLDDDVSLSAVSFLNDQKGFAAGVVGVIYRHEAGGYAISTTEVEQGNFSVFPNPVQHLLHITQTSVENATIRIFNNLGQFILSTSFGMSAKKTIDTSSLPPGSYVLQIVGSTSSRTVKFIKK